MKLETPSLLITDDDRGFRETLRSVFEPRGFHTLLASDGEEALEIIDTQPVHLIVLDMHMPRLSGLETIRQVKQLGQGLPCIFLSAQMDDELAEEARQLDAFSTLHKPVSCAEITGVVNRAMRITYDWPHRTSTLP